jgi:hypothetical protein
MSKLEKYSKRHGKAILAIRLILKASAKENSQRDEDLAYNIIM